MYSAFPLRSAGALRFPVRPVAFVTSSSFVLLSGEYFRTFFPLATYTVSAAERTDQTASPLIMSFLASFSSLTTAAEFFKASQAFLHEFQPLRMYAQSIFMLFLHLLYSVALTQKERATLLDSLAALSADAGNYFFFFFFFPGDCFSFSAFLSFLVFDFTSQSSQ